MSGRFSSFSLSFSDGPDCAQIMCDSGALYLHGTTDEMRDFADMIKAEANRCDERKQEAADAA